MLCFVSSRFNLISNVLAPSALPSLSYGFNSFSNSFSLAASKPCPSIIKMFYPARTTWQQLRKCEVMEALSLFVSSLFHKALFQMSFHDTKMNQSPPSKMTPCPFLLFLLHNTDSMHCNCNSYCSVSLTPPESRTLLITH